MRRYPSVPCLPVPFCGNTFRRMPCLAMVGQDQCFSSAGSRYNIQAHVSSLQYNVCKKSFFRTCEIDCRGSTFNAFQHLFKRRRRVRMTGMVRCGLGQENNRFKSCFFRTWFARLTEQKQLPWMIGPPMDTAKWRCRTKRVAFSEVESVVS